MLSEGHRRLDRGTDVVVGFVATYGRPQTVAMLKGLEIVAMAELTYRGHAFEEMDVDALLERAPEVALVDELAHTNIPGARHAKRWEDAVDALAAGIEVITTVNIQHLESLNDVIANVTGIRQQETIPDWLFDLADQVELVDMSPHALRRRMAHGNVYPDPRKAELALQRFFTMENLTALREMALLKVANQVDDSLLDRWTREGAAPDVRERVLVLVSRPGDISDQLIRRGARLAQRARGELMVLHVRGGEGATDPEWLASIAALAKDLGGTFDVIDSETPVDAVLGYAYRHSVTQIVVGESLRSRWKELMQGSFVTRLIRAASNLDIHVISRRER
jgi:two-component system sensor histidine kinase KdpD